MTRYAALITAGGSLPADLQSLCGTDLKALAPLADSPFIERVTVALRESGIVDVVGIVGDVARLQSAGIAAGVWAQSGETAPENIRRGIAALQAAGYLSGEERLLLCATDAVFLHADTVRELARVAESKPDADIVFPVVRERDYLARFPGSPNVWTPLAGESLTGSSVQVVRPAAMVRCLPDIERAFAARKSQWEMAKLLGAGVLFKFVTGTLTIAGAVKRIAQVTGLNVYAPIFPDARVAADIDSVADYDYARNLLQKEALSNR